MGVSIERELADLDRQITQLRVDYERFFSGDLKRSPEKDRLKLQDALRRLSQLEVDKAAERFRLQAALSRFHAFSEVWEKRTVAREEGRSLLHPASPPTVPPKVPPDAAARSSVKEPGRIDFSPLFERYCDARRALGEDVSRLRYEKFEELVRKQAEEIRKRTGMSRLVFEVQTTEGRVRLVGRPAAPKGKP